MVIKHSTTKTAGQKLHAVADWNAEHTGTATPESHGNEAHTSVFLTSFIETDPVFNAWKTATPPYYASHIDDGTTSGQMLYWNGSKWTYGTNLSYDDSNKKLTLTGGDSDTSHVFSSNATISTNTGWSAGLQSYNILDIGDDVWDNSEGFISTTNNAEFFPEGNSYYLVSVSNFSSLIPVGATILGIKVKFKISKYDGLDTATLTHVTLIESNSPRGDNKASSNNITTTPTFLEFGGPTDLWGTTWTRNQIIGDEDSGFAIAINKVGEYSSVIANNAQMIVYFSYQDVQYYAIGTDYSDGGKFKISNSETIGTDDIATFDKAFKTTILTTTQRDLISAVNGMIIYNSTTNKFQGYENGSWTNII